jgi:hypothetical protein
LGILFFIAVEKLMQNLMRNPTPILNPILSEIAIIIMGLDITMGMVSDIIMGITTIIMGMVSDIIMGITIIIIMGMASDIIMGITTIIIMGTTTIMDLVSGNNQK